MIIDNLIAIKFDLFIGPIIHEQFFRESKNCQPFQKSPPDTNMSWPSTETASWCLGAGTSTETLAPEIAPILNFRFESSWKLINPFLFSTAFPVQGIHFVSLKDNL